MDALACMPPQVMTEAAAFLEAVRREIMVLVHQEYLW
jgi:hypothetical protein